MYCCIYVNVRSALFCLVVQWQQGLLLCLYKPYIWNAAQRPPPPPNTPLFGIVAKAEGFGINTPAQ
jgi:hypothetical protein